MRILLVVPEWPPHAIGGGGRVYRQIARWLAPRHDVTVAYGDYTNARLFARCERAIEDNLQLVRVPLLPTPASMPWLRTALPPAYPAFSQLKALLKQRWDVVHLHGACIPMIDAAAAVLRQRMLPYVLTLHGVPASPLRRGYVIKNVFMRYARSVCARTVMGAARVTAVSGALLLDPLIPKREMSVIHNGLDDEDYAAFKDHRFVAQRPRLVSLSRLSVNKGIDVAIRAVKLIAARHMDVLYDVYGPDGGERPSFERLVSDHGLTERVRFLGAFDASDRSRIFAAADIVLVPSRVEGFGMVALEALAAGVPVVASSVDGLAEFLNDDAAVMVRPDDAAALADGIAKALEPRLRQRLIFSGRTLAQAFHWDALLPQYERVLISAVKIDVS